MARLFSCRYTSMRWNIKGDFRKYLTDPALRIPTSHIVKVCKRSSGSITCRYLSQTVHENFVGFVCVKNTPLKVFVDLEVNGNPKWRAKGDNCDGFVSYAQKKVDPQDAQGANITDAEASREKDDTSPS